MTSTAILEHVPHLCCRYLLTHKVQVEAPGTQALVLVGHLAAHGQYLMPQDIAWTETKDDTWCKVQNNCFCLVSTFVACHVFVSKTFLMDSMILDAINHEQGEANVMCHNAICHNSLQPRSLCPSVEACLW